MGPEDPLYAAVGEKLNERLAGIISGVRFLVDLPSREPYDIYLSKISIRGKDSKGGAMLLCGELVAVGEEHGYYEVIPSVVPPNLVRYPHAPQKIERISMQGAPDYLKATYQLECRARCYRERYHLARVCRECL